MTHHDQALMARTYAAARLDDADVVRAGRRLRGTKHPSTTRRRGRILLLVVATVVVAMAGSASAGGLITGKRIKDNSITGVDLRNNSIGSVDVKDGSLTEHDFDGSLVGQPGPPGPVGPPGPAGPQGPAGTAGLQYVNAPVTIGKGATELWAVSYTHLTLPTIYSV